MIFEQSLILPKSATMFLLTKALRRQYETSPKFLDLSDESADLLQKEPSTRLHWRILSLFPKLRWEEQHPPGGIFGPLETGMTRYKGHPVIITFGTPGENVPLFIEFIYDSQPEAESFFTATTQYFSKFTRDSGFLPKLKIYNENTSRKSVFFIFNALPDSGDLSNLREIDRIGEANYRVLAQLLRL